MTPKELNAIEARAFAAKAHEYEERLDEVFDCPLCGEGQIDGIRYDAKEAAATVVAYGIGADLKAAEDWVTHGPDDVLSLVAEVRRLQAIWEEK